MFARNLLIVVSLVSLATTAFSENTRLHTDSIGNATTRPVVDSTDPSAPENIRETIKHMEMYLAALSETSRMLEKANQSLLNEVDYAWVKIPALVVKGALDGYFTALLFGAGGATKKIAEEAAVATTTVGLTSAQLALHKTIETWLKSQGVKQLQKLGFNVAIIGFSGASNSALIENYQFQYALPIWGTSVIAYNWSNKLFTAAETLEKNHAQIYEIRKEQHKVRMMIAAFEKRLSSN